MRRRRPAQIVLGGSQFRAVRVSIPATLKSLFRAVSSTGGEGRFQEIQPRPTAGPGSASARSSCSQRA